MLVLYLRMSSDSDTEIFMGPVTSKERNLRHSLQLEQSSPIDNTAAEAKRGKQLEDVSVSLHFSSSSSQSSFSETEEDGKGAKRRKLPQLKRRAKKGKYFEDLPKIETPPSPSSAEHNKCLATLKRQLQWRTDPKTKTLKPRNKMNQVDVTVAKELLTKPVKNETTHLELLTCVHTVENARLIANTPDRKSPKSSKISYKVQFKTGAGSAKKQSEEAKKESILKSVLKKNHCESQYLEERVILESLASSSSDSASSGFPSPFPFKMNP